MAFPSKVDYLGLSDSDLILRDCDEGRSAEVAEATDENGDVAASEVFGEKNSPSASYAVKADVEKDLVLGAVTTVTDGGVTVGKPLVSGAKVTGKVLEQGKEKKILVFKYKAKSNYRRRQGHRQPFTKVAIEKIEA